MLAPEIFISGLTTTNIWISLGRLKVSRKIGKCGDFFKFWWVFIILGKHFEIFKNIFENFTKNIWAILKRDTCGNGKFFWTWRSVFDTGVVKISFPTLGQGTFSYTWLD